MSGRQAREVELSTATLLPALGWFIQCAGIELMLFAGVGLLILGFDDVLVDALYLGLKRHPGAGGGGECRASPVDAGPSGRTAIFIPAWQEAAVLPTTVRRMLAAWPDPAARFYLGCYANDAATLCAISPLFAADARLRLVINPLPGPSTKAENLNAMWHALRRDEADEAIIFDAVVLQDAEDMVHRDGLALLRRALVHHDMAQLPVEPLPLARSRWISGHYADEFAESHGRDLAVRMALGAPLPSAGVGCAFSRQALLALARHRGGQPFNPDSLTEDYEAGMALPALGMASVFVDARDARGIRVATRSAFPADAGAAARQKARWTAGIAFAGWDRLGWPAPEGPVQGWSVQAWAARWMLWRDRRAPLAALVTLAAYLALVLTLIDEAGAAAGWWSARPWAPGLSLLVAINLMLLMWRAGWRAHFTGRYYGWPQALLAVPRMLVSNVIAIMAAWRALALYWRILRSGSVHWDKTDHAVADVAPGAWSPVHPARPGRR